VPVRNGLLNAGTFSFFSCKVGTIASGVLQLGLAQSRTKQRCKHVEGRQGLELAAKRPNDPWDRFEQSSVTSARSTITKGAVIAGLDLGWAGDIGALQPRKSATAVVRASGRAEPDSAKIFPDLQAGSEFDSLFA